MQHNTIPDKDFVLYFGTGNWQRDSIRQILNLNRKIVVIGPEFSNIKDLPVTSKIKSDLKDHSGIMLKLGASIPAAIVCDTAESGVMTAAILAEKFKLPGIGIEVAQPFTDKYVMRQKLSKLFDNIFYTDQNLKEFNPKGKKFVLKPKRSQGSAGVYVFQSKKELSNLLTNRKYPMEDLMIESYLGKNEYTVDLIVVKGKIQHCAIGKKYKTPGSNTVASAIKYSVFDQKNPLHSNLYQKLENIINTLEYRNGIIHAELIYKKNNSYLVEIAARGGGSNIFSIVLSNIFGIDVVNFILSIFLDEKNSPKTKQKYNKSILAFFTLPEGQFGGVCFTHSTTISSPEFFHINLKLGEMIKKPSIDSERHGFVILFGKSNHEIDQRIKKFEEGKQCFIVNGQHCSPGYNIKND